MDPDSALLWVLRTREFFAAFSGGDPAGFAPTVHPGVTLMWLIGSGLGLWRMIGSWFGTMDIVEAFTWVIKMPVAITTSLLVVGCWRYLRQLVDRPTAVLAGVFFALDPLYLVFSRYVHLDALVTGLVYFGLLAIWAGCRNGRYQDLIIGGVVLMLGVLTRFNAIIASVVALGSIVFWGKFSSRVKPILIFFGASLLTALMVWPAILAAPEQLLFLLNHRIGLAVVPHEVPPNVDVIPWVRALLYPIFLLTREFPLLIFGAVIGFVNLFAQRDRRRDLGRYLVLFATLYYGALLVLPKDLDRYALPMIGPMTFVAAIGWKRVWEKVRWPVARVVILLVGLGQLIVFFQLAPYFQTYQNFLTTPLRHSPVRTSQALDPAWGEGIGEAMAYLRKRTGEMPPTAMWYVGIGCYYGHPHDGDHYPVRGAPADRCPAGLRFLSAIEGAEFIIMSRDQIAQRIYPKLIDDIRRLGWQPEHTVVINGKPIVYIYRNLGGLDPSYSLTSDNGL